MRRKGFSLIEVNMAILVAAGGLLSLFTLFPVGLRQSAQSEEDLYQATHANAIFEVLYAKASQVVELGLWNNERRFWETITKGTGISDKLVTVTDLTETQENDLDWRDGKSVNRIRVRYAGSDTGSSSDKNPDLSMPEQYLIRLQWDEPTDHRVGRKYRISLVCSAQAAPIPFHGNPVYSMELGFYGRVWAKVSDF